MGDCRVEVRKQNGRGRGRGRLLRPPDQPGPEISTSSSSEEDSRSPYHREQLLVIRDELSKSKVISYKHPGRKEPQQQEEIPRPPPPPAPTDYLLPQEISIASRGDTIKPGDKIICVTSLTKATVSPSLIYLSVENEYDWMDKFIFDMTRQYEDAWYSYNHKTRTSLTVPPDTLQVGGVFAVPSKNVTTGKREWLRAKVFERYPPGEKHTFVSLDLGLLFKPGDMPVSYLHKDLCDTPTWAIKCRVRLNDPEFEKYHQGILKWSNDVKTELQRVTQGRPMKVEFIRRVEQQGEMIWEVSLLNFEWDSWGIDPKRPIQDQVVERSFSKINNLKLPG